MTTSILRTADAWWVQTASRAARIDTDATTTRDLLADRSAIDAAAKSTDTVPVESLALLSPITTPCRVVAQATNFASHVKDVGRDPAKTPLTFFRKASGSVTGPFGDIVKPSHVQLMDYEREMGLVFGRELPVGTEVTAANLADFVVGLVVSNDVSARDVQLTKQQFFESKSYPTFTTAAAALGVPGGGSPEHRRRGRLPLPAGAGAAGAVEVPEARRRRHPADRHPGGHRTYHSRRRTEGRHRPGCVLGCAVREEPRVPARR